MIYKQWTRILIVIFTFMCLLEARKSGKYYARLESGEALLRNGTCLKSCDNNVGAG